MSSDFAYPTNSAQTPVASTADDTVKGNKSGSSVTPVNTSSLNASNSASVGAVAGAVVSPVSSGQANSMMSGSPSASSSSADTLTAGSAPIQSAQSGVANTSAMFSQTPSTSVPMSQPSATTSTASTIKNSSSNLDNTKNAVPVDVPSLKPQKPSDFAGNKKSLAEELGGKKESTSPLKSLADKLSQLKSEFVEESVSNGSKVDGVNKDAQDDSVKSDSTKEKLTKEDPLEALKKAEALLKENSKKGAGEKSNVTSEQVSQVVGSVASVSGTPAVSSTPVSFSEVSSTSVSTTPSTIDPNSMEKDLLANSSSASTPSASSVSSMNIMGSISGQMGAANNSNLNTNVASDTVAVTPLVSTTPSKGGKYPFTIEQLLEMVIERNASDLHINVGYPANIRVDGTLVPVCNDIVNEENAQELINPVLDEDKRDRLEVNREVDLAYAYGNKGRFRINAYHQRQTVAAAFRLIPTKIRSIDELNLPHIYHQLTKLGQGLVLVTGPTGHGKSTTLAAMIQEINHTRACHILTIEDPIEYVFPSEKAFVSQREIFDDTNSWDIALKSAMREDPNVILVGEMRDYETISAAITLAETGHLVFATLHTNNAAQTIDRIIDVFPENQQAQVRSQLASVIEAVVAQRLVPLDAGGRKAASEIMIANPAIRNLIREAKTYQIDNVIRTSSDIGMISLEQSLVKMVREGIITMEKAMRYAVRAEEIVRLLKE